jgi:hypothetical protein
MAVGHKTILAMVIAVAVVSVVHADMMPVGWLQTGGLQSLPACQQVSVQAATVEIACSHDPVAADLDLTTVELIPEAKAEVEQIRQTEPLRVLAYEPGSLNLCLCALVGLGLYRSAPWVRKLSFGIIPDWYHDGAPYQIGHSHAIGPEFLCRPTACCFVQLDWTCEHLESHYYLGRVVSFLHESLFVPWRLASRGPPACT